MLFLIVFPMTLLALAFYIALNFSTFAYDQNIGRKSFVQIYTWQRAAPVHHVLLISAYLFFIFGFGMGIPISILWIILLTLPLAGFQIFWLNRITQGGRPLWSFFNVLSASVYGLSAYLVALTLWTH
jgi:1,4-dihydroxy-2-naphthoate octaprenyltransferase